MKRHYLAILFMCGMILITACSSADFENVDKAANMTTEAEISSKADMTDALESEEASLELKDVEEALDEYVFLIKYNGEYYHYAQATTLIKPEKEVGEIKGIVAAGTLPQNDMEANGGTVGDILYMNPGEDVIYMKGKSGMEGEPEGMECYACYEKGIMTYADVVVDSYAPYVNYNGCCYKVKEQVEFLTDGFEVAETVHTWKNSYTDESGTTNLEYLLGGEIYAYEPLDNVIYVKSVSETKHEGGIWKCQWEG